MTQRQDRHIIQNMLYITLYSFFEHCADN